ncbi:MAG: hotdog fold thioesterase [Actinotalea sp.]|nr:hotdog fold thioesterase [Actinotalea sp.]
MTDTTAPGDAPTAPTPDPCDGPGTDPSQVALAEVRDSLPGTLMERMGIEILEAGPGRVVGTMPVHGNTQPYGLLHGGASVVLAETLGSYGAMLHAGPDRRAVGVEVGASHHRGATEGLVTGTATALHLGATTAVYEIVVEDSRSRRVCTARLTCLLIARRPD